MVSGRCVVFISQSSCVLCDPSFIVYFVPGLVFGLLGESLCVFFCRKRLVLGSSEGKCYCSGMLLDRAFSFMDFFFFPVCVFFFLISAVRSTEDSASTGSAAGGIDAMANLCLVPKFNERDPDNFSLSLEERECMWRGQLGL